MNKLIMPLKLLLIALALMTSYSFAADPTEQWQLDADNSTISFISIKKIHKAETHYFRNIEGYVEPSGQLTLKVDLASVDTDHNTRDKRMRKYLFEISRFADATVSTTVDVEAINTLAIGDSQVLILPAELDLHGEVVSMTLNIVLTRLSDNKVSAISSQPVILDVADFSLAAGVKKLKKLAGLPNISYAVPVSFYLNFSLK